MDEAFRAISLRYPNRFFIGAFHPTGNFVDFDELFENGKVKEEYKKLTEEARGKNGNPKCVRLFQNKNASEGNAERS